MDTNSNPVLSACVLAAGTSSRFGSTKLLQPFRGEPLVRHALAAAGGACPGQVYLVVGHDGDAVTSASAGLFDHCVVNAHFDDGIGTSIAAAVNACHEDVDAIIVILADQVMVTAVHISALIDTWSGDENEIVASSFDGIVCPPVLFPKNSYPALRELRGDKGAKSVLDDSAFSVITVDCPPAKFDIDRPEDLQGLRQD